VRTPSSSGSDTSSTSNSGSSRHQPGVGQLQLTAAEFAALMQSGSFNDGAADGGEGWQQRAERVQVKAEAIVGSEPAVRQRFKGH
jgi:hypothetical protein